MSLDESEKIILFTDQVIKLNVGGQLFQTYKLTLLKIPDSLLGRMFADSNKEFKKQEEYFFDRDPDIFKIILQYYRTGILPSFNNFNHNIVDKELAAWGIVTKAMEIRMSLETNKNENKIKFFINGLIESEVFKNSASKREFKLYIQENPEQLPKCYFDESGIVQTFVDDRRKEIETRLKYWKKIYNMPLYFQSIAYLIFREEDEKYESVNDIIDITVSQTLIKRIIDRLSKTIFLPDVRNNPFDREITLSYIRSLGFEVRYEEEDTVNIKDHEFHEGLTDYPIYIGDVNYLKKYEVLLNYPMNCCCFCLSRIAHTCRTIIPRFVIKW